jgi:hypothetical protein
MNSVMNNVRGRGSAMSANVRAMKDALMPVRLHRSNSLHIAWDPLDNRGHRRFCLRSPAGGACVLRQQAWRRNRLLVALPHLVASRWGKLSKGWNARRSCLKTGAKPGHHDRGIPRPSAQCSRFPPGKSGPSHGSSPEVAPFSRLAATIGPMAQLTRVHPRKACSTRAALIWRTLVDCM